MKFILKRRYASNYISIESKIFKNLWNKTQVRPFHEKLIKTWKRKFWSNHVAPDVVFLRAFKTQESGECWILKDIMVQLRAIRFTVFRWTIRFGGTIRVGAASLYNRKASTKGKFAERWWLSSSETNSSKSPLFKPYPYRIIGQNSIVKYW